MPNSSLSSLHTAIVIHGSDDGLDGGGLGLDAQHGLLRWIVLDTRRQPGRVADVVQVLVARQRVDAERDLFYIKKCECGQRNVRPLRVISII